MVKNPPAKQETPILRPWPEKIPHAVEQLSPCTTTIEPVLWSPQPAPTEPVGRNC